MRRFLPLLFGLVAVFFSTAASAVLITADTQYTPYSPVLVSGTQHYMPGYPIGLQTATSGAVASYLDERELEIVSSSTGDATGAFTLRAFGLSDAAKYVNRPGAAYTMSAAYSWQDTIVNAASRPSPYQFTLNITKGLLRVYDHSYVQTSPSPTGGMVYAEYFLDVLLNGHSVWQSGARLQRNGVVPSLTQSGVPLGGTLTPTGGALQYMVFFPNGLPSGMSYTNTTPPHVYTFAWNPSVQHINLGLLAAGSTNTLEYRARVAFGGSDPNLYTGGYAAGVVFNDPAQLSHQPGVTVSRVATVPEPGTLFLFGAGLAGLVWRRKRAA